MIRALLIALALASCTVDEQLEELPTCTELGCEFVLCQGPEGPCSCRPDPEAEPMLCQPGEPDNGD